MTLSRSMQDECFLCRELGVLVQIFHIIDAINAATDAEVFFRPVEELLALSRADRIDGRTVENMSEARRDEPVLIAALGGSYWIIDGNHRLARRQRDGFQDAAVVEVSPELLKPCVHPLGF